MDKLFAIRSFFRDRRLDVHVGICVGIGVGPGVVRHIGVQPVLQGAELCGGE